MKQGSVIVDLAAEAGGNCEATRPGELTVQSGVTIIGKFHSLLTTLRFGSWTSLTGYTDLPSRLPTQSSTLYSNNITKFLLSIGGDGKYSVDLNDEVVRGSLIVHNGKILPPVPRTIPAPAATPAPAKSEEAVKAITPWQKASREVALITAGMGTTVALGKATGTAFMDSFFTFGLAGLIGYRYVLDVTRRHVMLIHLSVYRVVWGVAPALHSPLMSVTNAISGLVSKLYIGRKKRTPFLIFICIGRCSWPVCHGRRFSSTDSPPDTGSDCRPVSKHQRIRRFHHHKTHAGHVQTYVSLSHSLLPHLLSFPSRADRPA